MAIAYIGLGANLGDRLVMLRRALDALAEHTTILAASSVYETLPQGYADQPDFLNAVVQVETLLSARDLLGLTQSIEERLGRARRERWGPRLIDLDILWYDGCVCHDADLVLPHPRMHQRAFVLVPLAEIAPGLVLPGSGKTASALARTLSATQRITKTDGNLRVARVWGGGGQSPSA